MNNQNPKPYPAYKPSGIPWLGDIPAHWEVVKSKSLFKEIIDKNHPKETLLSVTQENGVLPRTDSEIRVWNPGDDVTGYKLILPGDFVISLRSFQGGIELSNVKGIVSPAYIVLRRKLDIIDGYYKYWLKSKLFISVLSVFTTGIRQGKTISYDDFKEIPSLVPPLPEQQAIAAYLDGETARLDAVIAAYRRLLALLDEKRRALITHAVTRGLDPAVPLKDSGIEWLGQIPAHWEVRKLKQLVECLDGRRIPLNSDKRGRIQGEYPYWGANCIVDYINDWLYDEELVLLGEDGAPFFDKSKSVAFFVTGKIWVNNHAHVLRPKTVKGQYLAYALNVVDYKEYIDGSTRDKLTQLSMGTISLPIPPLPEQQAIAAYLDRETARLDGLKARMETLLARLQEYRAALISAAVTGKIDVTQTHQELA